jgi:hypothetical protein
VKRQRQYSWSFRCAAVCAVMLAATFAMAAAGANGSPGPTAAGYEKFAPEKSQDAQNASNQTSNGANQNEGGGLVIEPVELPNTYPHGPYKVPFYGHGNYVPTLHWSVIKGALPPGIKLDDNGLLHGEALRAGEFQFTIAVKDGGQPQQAVQREYVIKVVDAITIAWKVPAHVNANRIEGSVEVSNTTADDIDLTFDVKAVDENGRATEIGYQHFPLKKGTLAMALPFGETLPNGGYVVNVNVVGEVAKRNAIYRQQLQTQGPLQVTVGP